MATGSNSGVAAGGKSKETTDEKVQETPVRRKYITSHNLPKEGEEEVQPLFVLTWGRGKHWKGGVTQQPQEVGPRVKTVDIPSHLETFFSDRGKGRGSGPVEVSKSTPRPESRQFNNTSSSLLSHVNQDILKKYMTQNEKLDGSWDRPINARPEKTSLTDPDFASASKMVTREETEKCPHFIIPTNCLCSGDRPMGVCTKCYLLFCDDQCLFKGLETPNSRTSLGIEKYWKPTF